MKKFVEFGFGNRWMLRTEFENEDGTEHEVKGIVGPIKLQSIYLRLWAGQTVWIFDTKEGFKKQRKNYKSLKFIFGIRSDV